MPRKAEKAPKFRRLAVARTNNVLEQLRKLGNLSSSNYHYEEDEVRRIFVAIQIAVQEAKGHFQRKLSRRKPFTL